MALDTIHDCESAIIEGANRHSLPANKTFTYGTAGFREKAEFLDGVFYRTGILAALRSKCKEGDAIGIMITASHNQEEVWINFFFHLINICLFVFCFCFSPRTMESS